MKHIFILNPAAGINSPSVKMEESVRKTADECGIDYEIHLSESGGDIKTICHNCGESGGKYRIYAFGGDGTFNNAVNGCAGYANIEVGIVPVGTGNDFVKAAGVATDRFFDIKAQINGKSKPIDLIKYNGEYCANICNMGFDANTAIDMPSFKKIPFVTNRMAYYLALIKNFLKKWGRYMEIYTDGELLYKGDTMMCAVGNGISCGGGFYVTPRAVIDDGFIDVSAVSPPALSKLPKFIGYYMKGTQLQHEDAMKYIHYRKCKTVTVKAPEVFGMVNDGEPDFITEAHYEICPRRINLIIPE